jgi:hypothetical protein
LTHSEAFIKKKHKHGSNKKQQNAKGQESHKGEAIPSGGDGVNMDETQCQEDQGTKNTGKYFRDLWDGVKRHIRDPKFIIEVLALAGLIFYCKETWRTNNLTSVSIENAKHALQIQYRPWVNAQKVFPVTDVGVGTVPISVEIANAGNSPALHTVTYLEASPLFCLGDAKFTDHPPYAGRRVRPSTAMLLPNTGGIVDPYTVTIEQNIWGALQRGDCILYAYGTVTYCDVFGHFHWQHFCANWIRTTPRQFNSCYNYGDGDQDYPDAPLRSCPTEPPVVPPKVP